MYVVHKQPVCVLRCLVGRTIQRNVMGILTVYLPGLVFIALSSEEPQTPQRRCGTSAGRGIHTIDVNFLRDIIIKAVLTHTCLALPNYVLQHTTKSITCRYRLHTRYCIYSVNKKGTRSNSGIINNSSNSSSSNGKSTYLVLPT